MPRPDGPWEQPRSRNYRRFWDGPQTVGTGVDRVLKHLNAPTADVVESVFANWEDLVGEVIAKHTRPQRITNGVLIIEVDDPAWASEMKWMSEALLEQIRAGADTVEINEIRIALTS